MDQLDHPRQRVVDDLRGLVRGDVRGDDAFLQLYASDAGVCEITPLAVVRPRATADVVACVQYAHENRLPVHARGAGSGMAGGAVGPGIVVDLSRYMRRVLRIEDKAVRVQAGVVLERLNTLLRPLGRMIGPDPANATVTTIGGMIGVDAAGSHYPRYGAMHAHVQSVQVITARGDVLELGLESVDSPDAASDAPKYQVLPQLTAVLSRCAATIESHKPPPGARHGYHLSDLISHGQLNLPRLLCGAEGTLAIVTEATLATHPVPRHRGAVLLMFESLDKAARASAEILALGPAACDLVDRRHLSLAREISPAFERFIPPETEAALLVEQEGDEAAGVRDWLLSLADTFWHERRMAFGARHAFDREELQLFSDLTHKVQPMLYRMKGPSRPTPIIEDVAVPPAVLPDFVVRMQNVLKRHELTASFFCNAGQGAIHVQPFIDLPTEAAKLLPLAEDYYAEVFAVGGAIGVQHGCGMGRSAALRRHLGPWYDVLCEVKQAFDPTNLLNPGKIVGGDDETLLRNLAPVLSAAPAAPPAAEADAPPDAPAVRNLLELQLDWEPGSVYEPADACNRCGDCRTQAPDARMCPILRFAPSEEASPRAKANLIRGVLGGRINLEQLTSESFKQIIDLCVYCHACRTECPARVDIPRLVRQSKGAYVQANGLPRSEWFVTHLHLVAAVARFARPLVNWGLGNRWMRWILERTLGIAQGRKLPRLAARPFLRRAARSKLTRTVRREGRKVAYFVDVYANYFDPQVGEALVRILKRNGVAVYVPPQQVQAGMASISIGSLEHARSLARRNVAALVEAIRQGYQVVATEPAAALCLTREYPQLLDDDDARLVAANSHEACSYLWDMHVTGELQLDLKPINAAAGYHLPCHLRALGVGAPGEQLLRLIPGLRVYRVEEGCSGMAGAFGLLHKNYRSSLRAGWNLISRLRDPKFQFNATECCTCKMQMEQGSTKPTIHPIKLLALAYGLLPEGEILLTATGEELLVT